MAEISYTKTYLDRQTVRITWPDLNGGDTGVPYIVSGYPDKSIQANGTFNSLTLSIKGTNDDSNYDTLNDPSQNALTFTSAKTEQVLENTYKIMPSVSAGSGAAIDIIMTASTRGVDRALI